MTLIAKPFDHVCQITARPKRPVSWLMAGLPTVQPGRVTGILVTQPVQGSQAESTVLSGGGSQQPQHTLQHPRRW